jgi:hypothetical protein
MVFKPGESGNTSGRPKGSYGEYTQKFLTLRTKAAEDLDKVYAGLIAAIERGEQWAYQLYLKELVHFPIKEYQQLATINIRKNGVDGAIKSFVEGLEQIDQYNTDDVLSALKTLTSIKLTDTIAEKTNEAARLSDEQIKTVTSLVIDMNRSNDDAVAKDETNK